MARSMEIWLRSNRRVFLLAAVAPSLLLAFGLPVAFGIFVVAPAAVRAGAGLLAGLGAVLLIVLGLYARQPRLAFDGRHLLVYLRTRPIAVPIEFVECFLLASGLRELPGHAGRQVEVAHLAVRLAERATDWANVEVKPALGKWCGGYITIHGAWCEPLSLNLVRQLNSRLAEAQEKRRNDRLASSAALP
jgi:hypothetical protein